MFPALQTARAVRLCVLGRLKGRRGGQTSQEWCVKPAARAVRLYRILASQMSQSTALLRVSSQPSVVRISIFVALRGKALPLWNEFSAVPERGAGGGALVSLSQSRSEVLTKVNKSPSVQRFCQCRYLVALGYGRCVVSRMLHQGSGRKICLRRG